MTALTRPKPEPAPDGASTRVFDIRGMTCAACATRIETVLKKTPGVADATVNLALERADVVLTPAADDAVVVEAVDRAGYEASPRAADPAERRRQREAEEVARRAAYRRTLLVFAVSAVLTLPFLASMGAMLTGGGHLMDPWTELVLATIVQVVAGARFYRGAAKALASGGANMDVLVALGTTAAWGFSTWMVLTRGHAAAGHLYFEASAAVLTLILAGKLMEARAKAGTTAAVRALMALRPETATRLRDGREEPVPVEDLRAGDRVLIRPGERIPVDGRIVEGLGHVDESLVTGESVPVERGPGDPVVTGALNGESALVAAVTATGEDTTLARITRLVENAQSGKAPVQVLVDRISAVFVPVVVVVALVTFLGWLVAGQGFEAALVAAVSVLVIACPCALGLATPTALVAGTGAAARAGILIKDIETLERATDVDVVLFDKTGTLTVGRPTVVDIAARPGVSDDEVLALAAAVQHFSEHPLARAVVDAAAARGLPLRPATGFRAAVARGVAATVDGHAVAIGNSALMAERAIDTAALADAFARFEAAARTAVWVARDGEVIGVLALADPVRPEARAAVATLKARGIESRMLTGDNAAVASSVAADIGLGGWRGPVLPADKAGEVEALRNAGKTVAMVGDGVNDAPALAAADVGIAMGTGTDVAMETAAITLMRPDPRLVPAALEVAKATRAKIRQNLFWAFAYNVIGIPLAAFGVLTPALAGAAMALSSVSVVTNAGLLTRWTARLAPEGDGAGRPAN
ncbi:heavy metal translocating P-type ATPase [Chthonobacter rhizosphaerae]|uniref:heavy metal translocating P-type ATPase n=1 Tax=Chthonobacter rhizosphaerae TaxID=2735553 RepID=UPI0015EE8ED2|nr:heavy metal translocating P-type ATPase [Chthonobacter rhizosphaerae]